VKFSDLLAKSVAQGADFLATGHYARIIEDTSHLRLACGVDPAKDQSYFLYRLTETQMARVLFPVGELHKTDVRAFAERFGLAVARKAESQETCFAIEGDYVPVVRSRAASAVRPGEIVDRSGNVIGHHRGLAHHTVGQRKGLGIGGTADPLFVLELNAEHNQVVVGPHEALAVSRIEASDAVWHGGTDAVTAVVRYRMPAAEATAHLDGSRLVVEFAQPLFGVAAGQAVVCYRDDIVVGGGVIECAS
jgi:tRNA-specific 2-thiouridylase